MVIFVLNFIGWSCSFGCGSGSGSAIRRFFFRGGFGSFFSLHSFIRSHICECISSTGAIVSICICSNVWLWILHAVSSIKYKCAFHSIDCGDAWMCVLECFLHLFLSKLVTRSIEWRVETVFPSVCLSRIRCFISTIVTISFLCNLSNTSIWLSVVFFSGVIHQLVKMMIFVFLTFPFWKWLLPIQHNHMSVPHLVGAIHTSGPRECMRVCVYLNDV